MKKIYSRLLLLTAVVTMPIALSLDVLGHQTSFHNTLKHIESCEGKIKLALTRTWGDDETDDEYQDAGKFHI